MNARDAIRKSLESSFQIARLYLADFSDADLLVRPVPGANHVAWQLGHVIAAEARWVGAITGSPPALPEGFAEAHKKDRAAADDGFLGKNAYLSALETVRSATLAVVDGCSDADLDKPCTGSIAKFAPTWGAMFLLAASHLTTHAGQFVVVRRKLGKPIVM